MKFKIKDIDLIISALTYIYNNKKALEEYKNLMLDNKIEYPNKDLDLISNTIIAYNGNNPFEDIDLMQYLMKNKVYHIISERIDLIEENKAAFKKLIDIIKGNTENNVDVYITYDSVLDAFKRYIGGNLKVLINSKDTYKYAYWDNNKWNLKTVEDVKILYGDFIKKCNIELSAFDGESHEKLYKKLKSWKKLQTEKEVFNDISRDRDYVIDMNTYEYDPRIQATKDGKIINLITGEIKENTRNELILYTNDFKLCSKDDSKKFMNEKVLKPYYKILGNDRLEYLLNLISYKLLGKSMNKAIFLIGSGGTGKSFFRNIILEVFGDSVIPFSYKYLTYQHKGNDDTSRDDTLYNLNNKYVGLCSEPSNSLESIINASTLKVLLSGSIERTRRTRGKDMEDINLFNLDLIIDTNHYPKFTSIDQAIQRRLEFIVFTGKIDDPNPDYFRDIILKNIDLVYSYFIHRSIWLLESKKGILTAPAIVLKDTISCIEDIDPTQKFVDEFIEPSENNYIKVNDFVKEYESFCENQGIDSPFQFNSNENTAKNGNIIINMIKNKVGFYNVSKKRVSNGSSSNKTYCITGINFKPIEVKGNNNIVELKFKEE